MQRGGLGAGAGGFGRAVQGTAGRLPGAAPPRGRGGLDESLTVSLSFRSWSSSRCRLPARSSAASACSCRLRIFLRTASSELLPAMARAAAALKPPPPPLPPPPPPPRAGPPRPGRCATAAPPAAQEKPGSHGRGAAPTNRGRERERGGGASRDALRMLAPRGVRGLGARESNGEVYWTAGARSPRRGRGLGS